MADLVIEQMGETGKLSVSIEDGKTRVFHSGFDNSATAREFADLMTRKMQRSQKFLDGHFNIEHAFQMKDQPEAMFEFDA